MKEIAPSAELRKWFGHEPRKWDEFQSRYRNELKNNSKQLSLLRKEAAKERITMLYAARDEEHISINYGNNQSRRCQANPLIE